MRRLLIALLAAASLAIPVAAQAAPAHHTHHIDAPATPNKLIIVYLENHALTGIISDPADMPWMNARWHDPAVEQFSQFFSETHPSFPNYAAFATGSTVTTSDSIHAGQFNVPILWDQLSQAGVSWGVYQEGMPSACYAGTYYNDTSPGGTDGPYKIGHNPAIFDSVITSNPAECANVQPLSALSTAALPAVSFVTPNLCDDLHGVPATDPNGYQNCVTKSSGLETRTDTWLANHVPAWTAAGADVIVTFDEANYPMYTIMMGPGVTGGVNSTRYNHYSILAAIEGAYGLPLLGNAATATPITIP